MIPSASLNTPYGQILRIFDVLRDPIRLRPDGIRRILSLQMTQTRTCYKGIAVSYTRYIFATTCWSYLLVRSMIGH